MNAQEVLLAPAAWHAQATAHAERIDAYLAPHLARRETGVKHPIFDFLFTYYSYRPAQLRRWHPGFGIALHGASDYRGLKGYADAGTGAGQTGAAQTGAVGVSADYVASQRPVVEQLHTLLRATAARTPHLGCFGLHEWAMVYRQDQTRHPWPLRLGAAGTDEVVEGNRIACSHFDAFRFFTPPARGLNTLQPARDDRPDFEQPGCLHAGMDLYKHAFRLSPMISSDVVADCFELAWDIRVMDMRAAPYDLTGLALTDGRPWSPIKIETAEGKRDYAESQREFAVRAAPLRQHLIAECERLLPGVPTPLLEVPD
ncbi:MAG: 3-methyladenine DNA glycosylase [Nocardioidaceae bacterium]|nr:3-methyladenine DNA glycosylase [Nocardioidaceae bacterium]